LIYDVLLGEDIKPNVLSLEVKILSKYVTDFLKLLPDGNIYLNIRTVNNPVGEIEGKVKPALHMKEIQ
jgi:hypothetical protein